MLLAGAFQAIVGALDVNGTLLMRQVMGGKNSGFNTVAVHPSGVAVAGWESLDHGRVVKFTLP